MKSIYREKHLKVNDIEANYSQDKNIFKFKDRG